MGEYAKFVFAAWIAYRHLEDKLKEKKIPVYTHLRQSELSGTACNLSAQSVRGRVELQNKNDN